MTLIDVIERRSRLPVDEEVRAWAADKRQAEAVYLAAIRLCDERIFAAWQRMRSDSDAPGGAGSGRTEG